MAFKYFCTFGLTKKWNEQVKWSERPASDVSLFAWVMLEMIDLLAAWGWVLCGRAGPQNRSYMWSAPHIVYSLFSTIDPSVSPLCRKRSQAALTRPCTMSHTMLLHLLICCPSVFQVKYHDKMFSLEYKVSYFNTKCNSMPFFFLFYYWGERVWHLRHVWTQKSQTFKT